VKVLIAGLGSIGQRHVRNLRAVLGDGVEILAYRTRGLPHVITESMQLDDTASVEDRYGVRSFTSLDQALSMRPDAVFVCNPTSHHLATALAAVRAGCHVLIEKPLSHAYDGVEELIETADRQGRIAAVGYQMRCHPALLRLRELVCRKAIGRVVSVRAEMGEYLPDAHPYEDYRVSYAARAVLGGGVILCYVHEYDYLSWLFGMPSRVFTMGGRLGHLEIDVEDTALTTLECEVDGAAVMMQLHHSFLQRPASRTCEVVGECGTIRVDLNRPSMTVASVSGVETHTFDGFKRNDLFVTELKHFLSAIGGADAPIVTAREAAQSLRIALAARASLASGQAVCP
jgi:predicted dehydrogenase